jgi:hypothetical protein
MTAKIINLFPIPIYQSLMNIKFNREQLKYVALKYKDKNPLNLKILKELKISFEDACKNCLSETLSIDPMINIKITSSKFDYCLNGFSNSKKYYNSYLTGVYCFQSNKDDTISFTRGEYSQIKLKPTKQTKHNSYSWEFDLEPGELHIFPSWLAYKFNERIKQEEDRVLIVFNTYITNISDEKFMKLMVSLDDKKELIIV